MANLSISLLGSFQVSIADAPITALESDKVCALLAYLVVESSRPHRRETLVGLLWPDYPEESARHNLRQALFNLRSVLGDRTAPSPYLLVTRDSIQFNRESDYSLDLLQFNHHFFTCEDNLSQCVEDCSTHATHLEEMVVLYRGEFLEQLNLEDSTEFDEWVLIQRESLHQRVQEAHHYLSNYYELHLDFKAARRHALRQIELDPWREEAHRQLMRVLAFDGQRSAALAQYETCKRVLAKELDVEPSAETRELYEQIRQGTLLSKTEPLAITSFTPVNNLPVHLTRFIGREHELAYLQKLFTDPECRCITLMGPGGIGKTRLAVQAATDDLNHFAQGAAFINLASVGSFAGVIPAIANAVDFTFYGPGNPVEHLLNYLCDKQMLLIMDNVEHLLFDTSEQENFSQLIIKILQKAPVVKLLVTTRQALNLQEEYIVDVQGLAFPQTAETEGFSQFEAVILFEQRARRALPGFESNVANHVAIADILGLVEGMPLAIELAATWMRILTPSEIAEEIRKDLDFLRSSVKDLPERHRSMRVVFDYSWRMLSEDEQNVLSRLSVFRGGFQRQAADQVAGATLSILSTLVNRTLLRRTSDGRYDLHELVRQYGSERLAADPQANMAAHQRHFAFYLSLAEAADQGLKGPDQLEWLVRLEQEHDNLRAALEWALEVESLALENSGLAARLAGSLRWFWRMRGHFHEGSDWLTEGLKNSPEQRTAARASALLGISILINAIGDLAAALPTVVESIAIYRELGDQDHLAEALMIEGLTLLWQGEATLGQSRIKEALANYRQVGDQWGEAQALYRLGTSLADYGGDISGRSMLEESATILEHIKEKYLYTSVLVSIGIIDMSRGDYIAAKSQLERSLAATREIRHPWGIADALTNLGCLYRIQGDYKSAQVQFNEAHQVYQEHGRNIWETDVLCAMTENDIDQNNLPAARIHLKAASDLLGFSENAWLQVLVRYFKGLLAFYEGDLAGAAVLLDEAIDYARQGQFKPDLARSLATLGRVKHRLGQMDQATKLIHEALHLFQEFGNKLGVVTTLESLAMLNVTRGNYHHAVMQLAAAHTTRNALAAPLPPIDQPACESALASCRAQLGDVVFNDIWTQAVARSIVEVLEDISRED